VPTGDRPTDRFSGGHYLLIVKANQGTLEKTIELLLGSPVACRVERRRVVEREVGHGRIERRELVCSAVLAGRHSFPGLGQILRLERERQEKRTGKREVEVVHGITSLTRKQAGPRQLLGLARGHWLIENRSHYVRDVTYGEDRSQVRDGTVAHVMAALRNAAIGRLRLAGHANIAAATRYYAARPREALALLGLAPDF
jgi:predicted transposase YbfD/YdcC